MGRGDLAERRFSQPRANRCAPPWSRCLDCKCYGLRYKGRLFYRWKKKFQGMGVAEVRRLRILEEENRKLKQLVADLSLDKQMLQDVLRKKP